MKKLLVVSMVFFTCSLNLIGAPHVSKVEVALVSQGTLTQKQTFNGTLSFNQKSKIAAQSAGAITKIHFDKGQRVAKGDLLLEIDSLILDATIEALKSEQKEAELKLELAKIDFKRYEALYKNATVAKQKFDELYYEKEQAKQAVLILASKVKAQMIARDKKRLYAAFSGMMVTRDVEQGEWVKEGDEVALLVNPRKIDLLFHLPSSYLNHIQPKQLLKVEINHQRYPAKVIGRLLSGDANTRTFPLLLQLQSKNGKFFEGMQASIVLEKPLAKDSLQIPRDAIIRKYDKTVIYVVDKGSAKLINVTIMGFHGSQAAVIGKGLKAGMQVITQGNERLYPGAKVAIQ